MRNIKNKQSGFTLFELIGIFVWLTLVIGMGYIAIHFIAKFW